MLLLLYFLIFFSHSVLRVRERWGGVEGGTEEKGARVWVQVLTDSRRRYQLPLEMQFQASVSH